MSKQNWEKELDSFWNSNESAPLRSEGKKVAMAFFIRKLLKDQRKETIDYIEKTTTRGLVYDGERSLEIIEKLKQLRL